MLEWIILLSTIYMLKYNSQNLGIFLETGLLKRQSSQNEILGWDGLQYH